MKYEKLNLIHIQTKDNLVILTHKLDTLITLTTFLKKCEKSKGDLYTETEGVNRNKTCLQKRKLKGTERLDKKRKGVIFLKDDLF